MRGDSDVITGGTPEVISDCSTSNGMRYLVVITGGTPEVISDPAYVNR